MNREDILLEASKEEQDQILWEQRVWKYHDKAIEVAKRTLKEKYGWRWIFKNGEYDKLWRDFVWDKILEEIGEGKQSNVKEKNG